MDFENHIKEYKKNGLTVFKNIFSENEIDTWRKTIETEEKMFSEDILDSNRDFYSHLIFNKGFLDKVLLNEKIINLVKKILGEEIYFFGDASLNRRRGVELSKTGHFHVDSKNDIQDPYTSNYRIIRVGIYLQDIKNFSGGLKIRIGSHRHLCLKGGINSLITQTIKFVKGKRSIKSFGLGKISNLDTQPGDVAIWNLRLHHCGNSKRNKFFPSIALHPWLDRNLPESFFCPIEKRRLVFFAIFASKSSLNSELHSYLINRLDGTRNLSFYKNSGLKFEEAEKLFKYRGVNLINTENYT